MYEKVLVLQCEARWALAMRQGGEIVRIRLRKGLKEGDIIFILPEDLYQEENKVLPFAVQKQEGKGRRRLFRQLGGVAAVLALCLLLFLPQFTVEVSAVASFDAEHGIQVEMDADGTVLRATSVDGSIPQEELKVLEGRNISQVGGDLARLVGGGSFLIGYVPKNGAADTAMESKLQNMFPERETVYLSGQVEDLSAAEQNTLSVGQYMAGRQIVSPELDDLDDLDDLKMSQLLEMLEQNQNWMNVPEFREALSEKQEELLGIDLDNDDDDKDEDRDNDHDDDTDDDEDDKDDEDENDDDDDEDEDQDDDD